MEFDGNTCIMIVETLSSLKVNLKRPYVGMLFNDTEEMHTFYINYARSEGLGIVRQSLDTGLDENWRYFTLACSRGAKYLEHKVNAISMNSLHPKTSSKTELR